MSFTGLKFNQSIKRKLCHSKKMVLTTTKKPDLKTIKY